MSDRLNQLAANLERVLGGRAQSIEIALGEVTVVLNADTYAEAALLLRNDPALAFEQLIDLCGVDTKNSVMELGQASALRLLHTSYRSRITGA